MRSYSPPIGKLMRRAVLVLAISVAAISFCPGVAFANQINSKWETPKSERTDARIVSKDSDTEIRAAKGVIIVTVSRPTQIKVYSILGQLVSRETIPAGTSQLYVPAHGVYIIKTSELTCKVAL